MFPRSPLEDPRFATHAWRRYFRLMRWMFGATLVMLIVMFSLLYHELGMVSIHFYIAVGLAVVVSTMLMSTLMGLVFLSSGTGHDESVTGKVLDGESDGDQSAG